MNPSQVKTYIWVQAAIMTVGIAIAGYFLKDPPKNWWPKEIDPLNWHKHSPRDLRNNPPALRHYTVNQMWRTPQAKWVGIQYALYVGCSLFGVAYYVPFAEAKGLGLVGLVGFAGFALADGGFRPMIVVDDPGRDGNASTTIMDRVSIRCLSTSRRPPA